MNDDTDDVDLNGVNLTRRELCKLDKISLATLYAIEKAGYGREWLIYPGTNIKRITPAGRRAWHEKLQQYRADHAEALAAQRRQRSDGHLFLVGWLCNRRSILAAYAASQQQNRSLRHGDGRQPHRQARQQIIEDARTLS
jgi:hypothetical protein